MSLQDQQPAFKGDHAAQEHHACRLQVGGVYADGGELDDTAKEYPARDF